MNNDKRVILAAIEEANTHMRKYNIQSGRCLVFAGLMKKQFGTHITCLYNSDHIIINFCWQYLFDSNGIIDFTERFPDGEVIIPKGFICVEAFGQKHFETSFADCLLDPKYLSWMFGKVVLKDLNAGDLFLYNGKYYIALALTPDGFKVECLCVESHELFEIGENEEVVFDDNASCAYKNVPGMDAEELRTRY